LRPAAEEARYSAGCGFVRINAAAREHGSPYGQLINGLKNAGITARSQEPVRAGDLQPRSVCVDRQASEGRREDRA